MTIEYHRGQIILKQCSKQEKLVIALLAVFVVEHGAIFIDRARTLKEHQAVRSVIVAPLQTGKRG